MTTEVPSFDLSPAQLAHIGEVGAALFEGRALQASRSGLIEISTAFQPSDEKGKEHVQWEGSRGPTTEPRQRRQGPPPSSNSHSTQLSRGHYRAQVRQLDEYYPGVRSWMHDDGTWLSVRLSPIGNGGPRAKLVIAIPKKMTARVTAWGFWDLDSRCSWIGHRHTNYPDGSICAFPVDGEFWREGDTLCAYIDLLAEWTFRQLYYAVHGIWPGPQEGRWRYYRLLETRRGECCPRCKSLKAYDECCRALDEAEAQESDRLEFIAEVGCDLGEQRPHRRVSDFASGLRARPPRMAYVLPAIRSKPWNPND